LHVVWKLVLPLPKVVSIAFAARQNRMNEWMPVNGRSIHFQIFVATRLSPRATLPPSPAIDDAVEPFAWRMRTVGGSSKWVEVKAEVKPRGVNTQAEGGERAWGELGLLRLAR
jgi:hypothetical protein